MKITFESKDYPKKTIEIKGKRNEVMYMLYKYSAILDVNPMADKYDEVKGKMDNTAREFGYVNSSLQEMDIKEQLKFYVEKNIAYNIKDRDRMFDLIDML